jgi:hypothetical protein
MAFAGVRDLIDLLYRVLPELNDVELGIRGVVMKGRRIGLYAMKCRWMTRLRVALPRCLPSWSSPVETR